MSGKSVVPANEDVESTLLGAMMLDDGAREIALAELSASDFNRPLHMYVFTAIAELAEQGEPCRAVSVEVKMRGQNIAVTLGDLLAFEAGPWLASNVGRYVTVLRSLSRLRKLAEVGRQMIDAATAAGADPDDVAEMAMGAVEDVAGRPIRAQGPIHLGRSLNGWLEEFTSGDGPRGVATGWVDLNRLITSLAPGHLVVVGGRPGQGKSAIAEALAVDVASMGSPVLIVSAEMHLVEVQDRFVAMRTRIPLGRLRRRGLSDEEWAKVSPLLVSATELPVEVLDDSGATLSTVKATVRRMARRPEGLGLVIIDYLQLIRTAGRAENRQLEVAEVSRELKRLARSALVPVVALSSLSRSPGGEGERPTLKLLRDSGNIESDADLVILLYRAEMYDRKTEDRGLIELIIAKQRHGPTGTVKLRYDPATGRFSDIPSKDKAEPLSMNYEGGAQ